MFLGKSKPLMTSQKKSKLDHFLWFMENYLPQKKNRFLPKKSRLDTLEAEIIYQIQKFDLVRYKFLKPKQTNKKVSLTFGSWALPFIKLLKRIGLLY